MSFPRIIIGITFLLPFATAIRAGPVTMFTDFDAFLAAAGDVREIDFETLPDGTPSFSGAEITPDFNYRDQGIEFFSPAPWLFIAGNAEAGFRLKAGNIHGSGGPRNWIIAEPVLPATAVGIVFPGTTIFSVFDTTGELIVSQIFGTAGTSFAGIVSDVPIGSVTFERGIEVESINSFFFVPIPEPATLVLVALGALVLPRRRRSVGRHEALPSVFEQDCLLLY